MMAAQLLLSLVAAVGPLSVAQLEERHQELLGKTVRVEGLLAECQPLSCGLLQNRETDPGWKWLSFASNDAFDQQAKPFIKHRLIVEGVVLDHCWLPAKPNKQVSLPCVDRGPQFNPVKIVRDLGEQ